jgi:hypothetical protein
MLLWALNPGNPYSYYLLLRWVCCGVFAYLAVQALESKRQGWVWVLGITALIYNPLIPVHLTREIWSAANVATIGVAVTSIFALKSMREFHNQLQVQGESQSANRPARRTESAMSEEEAVSIWVEFCNAYVLGHEEGWLFKPESLLPGRPSVVAQAMRVSYQTGCPFAAKLEGSYRHCVPQIAFFIPDNQFLRASVYFERFFDAMKESRSRLPMFDYTTATAYLSPGGIGIADSFFERKFLVRAPADPDKEWIRRLARRCWRRFRVLESGWSGFVDRVRTKHDCPELIKLKD